VLVKLVLEASRSGCWVEQLSLDLRSLMALVGDLALMKLSAKISASCAGAGS
jgi:hypothetical protein